MDSTAHRIPMDKRTAQAGLARQRLHSLRDKSYQVKEQSKEGARAAGVVHSHSLSVAHAAALAKGFTGLGEHHASQPLDTQN